MTATETILQLKDQILGQLRKKGLTASESEDVFQRSLLKAIESIDSIRDSKKLENWFRVVVKNEVMDVFRARKKDQKIEKEIKTEAELSLQPEFEALLCQCVSGLMKELKDEFREPIEAVFYDEKSTKKAAQDLGITENLLKVRVHRAKKELRKSLARHCGMKDFKDLQDCDC